MLSANRRSAASYIAYHHYCSLSQKMRARPQVSNVCCAQSVIKTTKLKKKVRSFRAHGVLTELLNCAMNLLLEFTHVMPPKGEYVHFPWPDITFGNYCIYNLIKC